MSASRLAAVCIFKQQVNASWHDVSTGCFSRAMSTFSPQSTDPPKEKGPFSPTQVPLFQARVSLLHHAGSRIEKEKGLSGGFRDTWFHIFAPIDPTRWNVCEIR
jgi:hypothetical protein